MVTMQSDWTKYCNGFAIHYSIPTISSWNPLEHASSHTSAWLMASCRLKLRNHESCSKVTLVSVLSSSSSSDKVPLHNQWLQSINQTDEATEDFHGKSEWGRRPWTLPSCSKLWKYFSPGEIAQLQSKTCLSLKQLVLSRRSLIGWTPKIFFLCLWS